MILNVILGILGLSNLWIFIVIAVVIIAVINAFKSDEEIEISVNQTNKVINISLNGGIIGMLSSSPRNALNSKIQIENTKGWRVIQVIPADSGNLFLTVFRLLLLICTLFLYTTANGYYVIMEREKSGKLIDKLTKSANSLKCSNCGKEYSSSQAGSFCEECGNQL